jgi:hypothetical protein
MTLRRVDWRYLLPAPNQGDRFGHLLVLGAPAGLDRELVEAGVAARVSTTVRAGERADALAVLAGADADLGAAVNALEPGGVLYWEIDRRGLAGLRRTPRGIARALRSLDLRLVATYWVVPDFQQARRFLPLDRPGAARWFFSTRFVASSLARLALRRAVLAAAGRGARALGALAPCVAVIATRSGATRPTAPSHPGFPAVLREPEARLVLLTSAQDDGSRIVVLPFREAAERPGVVFKLARRPDFDRHTAQEQATLRHLRGRLSADLARTLPTPLGAEGSGAGRGFLESPVGGHMLAVSTGRWGASTAGQIQDLRVAADWLARFHRETTVARPRWGAETMARWVEPSIARFERAVGAGDPERRLFDALRAHAATLAGQAFPVVTVHNDFNPWHVYRAGESVSVIDWEFGQDDVSLRQGPALCDLLYFANHWLNLARGVRSPATEARAFEDLFLRSGRGDRHCRAARAAFATYLAQVELSPGFLPLLLAVTWIERAADRGERLQALRGGGEGGGEENQFVVKVAQLAKAKDRLFGGPVSPP